MRGLALLLPVLVALQVGVQPALAWAWPVDGPVVRPFVLGDNPYAGGQHRGIDIATSPGASIRAPAAGSVSFAGTVPVGGKTITILTPEGYAVTVQHLGAFSVARGASVAEGDAIATSPPAGSATGPSIYLGIRVADDPNGYVDPLTLLPPPPAPVEAPATLEPAADPQAEPAAGPESSTPGHAQQARHDSHRRHRSERAGRPSAITHPLAPVAASSGDAAKRALPVSRRARAGGAYARPRVGLAERTVTVRDAAAGSLPARARPPWRVAPGSIGGPAAGSPQPRFWPSRAPL
jgi:hypothetical protein